jgi:hypothetical protein
VSLGDLPKMRRVGATAMHEVLGRHLEEGDASVGFALRDAPQKPRTQPQTDARRAGCVGTRVRVLAHA